MLKSGKLIWIISALLITNLVYSQPPDTLWTHHYGGWLFDYTYDVRSTADGGFIVTAISNSYPAPYYQVYLVKADSDGNQLWYKTYLK